MEKKEKCAYLSESKLLETKNTFFISTVFFYFYNAIIKSFTLLQQPLASELNKALEMD